MTPKTGMTQSLAALFVGGVFIASQAVADAPDALGTDIEVIDTGAELSYPNSAGNAIKTGLGECLRLGGWNDDETINACEGIEDDVADAAPAAEPEPAPVETAPSEPTVSTEVLDGSALFNTNSSDLTPGAEAALADLLAKLESYDDISAINITGHTDDRGEASYNQTLSVARARTVAKFLVGSYPNATISAFGKGETNPVATNSTPEGRQQNRRVEIDVTAKRLIQN